MIYRHGKHAYAIGMIWSDFVGRTEAKAHVRKAARPWLLAEVESNLAGQPSVAVGLAQEQRLHGAVSSAAVAIGRLFPDAVIRQTLPDGMVWVARLMAGVPCAGRDEVIGREEAALLQDELAGHDAVLIGDSAGARLTLDEALTLFEQQVDDGRIDRARASVARLQPAMSLARPLAATAVLLLVLTATGAGLWTWRGQLRDAESRRAAFERLTVSETEARRRAAERQQVVAQFARTVAQRRQALAAQREDPAVQWLRWDSARRQLPLSINGYVPDSMQCDRSQCTVTWNNSGPRVRLIDRAVIANRIGEGAPLATPRSKVDMAPANDPGTGLLHSVSPEALQLALAQALQFEGAAAGVGHGRPETVAPPVDSGLVPVVVGATGELRLTASGSAALVRANDVVRALRGMPVRLDSLRWTDLASHPAMVAEGRWIFLNP